MEDPWIYAAQETVLPPPMSQMEFQRCARKDDLRAPATCPWIYAWYGLLPRFYSGVPFQAGAFQQPSPDSPNRSTLSEWIRYTAPAGEIPNYAAHVPFADRVRLNVTSAVKYTHREYSDWTTPWICVVEPSYEKPRRVDWPGDICTGEFEASSTARVRFLDGPPGVGKTTLLSCLNRPVTADERDALALDSREYWGMGDLADYAQHCPEAVTFAGTPLYGLLRPRAEPLSRSRLPVLQDRNSWMASVIFGAMFANRPIFVYTRQSLWNAIRHREPTTVLLYHPHTDWHEAAAKLVARGGIDATVENPARYLAVSNLLFALLARFYGFRTCYMPCGCGHGLLKIPMSIYPAGVPQEQPMPIDDE